MSNFGVQLWTVDTVAPHPNADKLEVLHLKGLTYQFVVGKGEFKKNQLVAYFPLDAVIPNELATLLKLPVKEGKPFRVKSIRLRMVWSEGVIAPLSVIGIDPKLAEEGLDLTKELGVVKYEPVEFQENIFKGQRPDNLIALPATVRKYDIENLQRYPATAEALKDVVVVVTEKLEGSHWWARIDRDGLTVHVGQRNFEIKRGDENLNVDQLHPFWQLLYQENLDTFLYWLVRHFPGYDITIRGEAVGMGIQGNYYGLKGREVYLFELELNGDPVPAQTFIGIVMLFRNGQKHGGLKIVPVINNWNTLGEIATSVNSDLVGEGDNQLANAIVEYTHGRSSINPAKLREGVVIKPAINEMYHPEIGRMLIKVRDATYLAQ